MRPPPQEQPPRSVEPLIEQPVSEQLSKTFEATVLVTAPRGVYSPDSLQRDIEQRLETLDGEVIGVRVREVAQVARL